MKAILLIKYIVLVILLSFFYQIDYAKSFDNLDVVINEIAWMGTENSYSDEWIELYNNTDSNINLEGWVIRAPDGTFKINLSGIISAKSFYLLERTDDAAVPDIAADKIYTGSLNNKGEHLNLLDSQDNLIDELNCIEAWFSGDNSTKQTMERKNSQSDGNNFLNWENSKDVGGTPKNENGASRQKEKKDNFLNPTESAVIKEKPSLINYPSGIVFSEILPSPKGADSQEEWIEVLNENPFLVDLSGWSLSDKVGAVNIYFFENGTVIKGGEFFVLSRKETKITLNNQKEELLISNPNKTVVDTVVYENAPLGKSLNRTPSGWRWSFNLTPGGKNIINSDAQADFKSADKINGKERGFSELEGKNEKIGLTISSSEKLASLTAVPRLKINFFKIFLVSIITALLCGVSILMLKKKIENLFTID